MGEGGGLEGVTAVVDLKQPCTSDEIEQPGDIDDLTNWVATGETTENMPQSKATAQNGLKIAFKRWFRR